MAGASRQNVRMGGIYALLLNVLAVLCSCTIPPAFPRQPAQQCYVGPIDGRAVNPDGSPAVRVPLGVFGGVWSSEAGAETPSWTGQARTDEQGRYHRDSVRECEYPTFFYAYDDQRTLAGFCVVHRLADLAKPQTVQLQHARWVTGEIVCRELLRRGESCQFVCAAVSPVLDSRLQSRWLRYYQGPSHKSQRFRFLLPPGDYDLDLQADGAKLRRDGVFHVPPGDGPLELGTFDLELAPLVRLIGQPAPPLDVVEWSDGKNRTLAELRGRPVLLCFWQKNLCDALKQVFAWYRKLRGSDIELLLIHPPEPGGAAAVRTFLIELSAASYPDIELDLNRWPFPTAIDRFSGRVSPAGYRFGASALPYGDFGVPLFVLIDREGRVAATTGWRDTDFIAALEKLLP